MRQSALSPLQEEILKALYCRHPRRNLDDAEEERAHSLGVEMVSKEVLELEIYLLGRETFSDLPQKVDPAVCLPQGVFRFIYSLLRHPLPIPESEEKVHKEYHLDFYDALRDLIARKLMVGFTAGYRLALSEDGCKIPIPLPWSEKDAKDRIIGVDLTREGFVAARGMLVRRSGGGE